MLNPRLQTWQKVIGYIENASLKKEVVISHDKLHKLRQLAAKAFSEETEQSKQINIELHQKEEMYNQMKELIGLGRKSIESIEKSIEDELIIMEAHNQNDLKANEANEEKGIAQGNSDIIEYNEDS